MYDFQFAPSPTTPTRREALRAAARAMLDAPAFRVGQRVNVPALGLANVEVVAVVPSRTVGGETKFRISWYEPLMDKWSEANLFAEELTVAE